MNPLLKRQIDKKLKGGLNDLDLFLEAINESYVNFEDQIALLQRAMKISSDELFQANQKLREESESLKEVNKNLKFILNSMSVDVEIISKVDSFKSLDYIRQQSVEIVKISKQREELLLNLEKQNQVLNEYAHMVSHDLKAPLRSIDTLINWFIEDNQVMMNDDNTKSLNLILSNVEKMDLLIKGILDYSAIETQYDDDRIIDLSILVNEILRTNVTQNAIKYNDKENIEIEIGSTENDNEFSFYIKDNGIGIPEVYQNKIFDMFSKLENNDSSSGIGLSIVKKIIDFYKGKIWLESQEHKGTIFYFTIAKEHGAA